MPNTEVETTELEQQKVKETTMNRQTAERIAGDELLLSRDRKHLADAIEKELDDRDRRAVKIINDHRLQDVCNDNCWTTIKAAIRKED